MNFLEEFYENYLLLLSERLEADGRKESFKESIMSILLVKFWLLNKKILGENFT